MKRRNGLDADFTSTDSQTLSPPISDTSNSNKLSSNSESKLLIFFAPIFWSLTMKATLFPNVHRRWAHSGTHGNIISLSLSLFRSSLHLGNSFWFLFWANKQVCQFWLISNRLEIYIFPVSTFILRQLIKSRDWRLKTASDVSNGRKASDTPDRKW